MKNSLGMLMTLALIAVTSNQCLALEKTVTGDLFERMRFGVNAGLDAIGPLRDEHKMNLEIATTWLNSRKDIDTQLRRESLEAVWRKGYIPAVITWGWMEHSYKMEEPVPPPNPASAGNSDLNDRVQKGAGYQAYKWTGYTMKNLKRFHDDWINDCRRMARIVQAPNDGKHLVIFSFETEFNCYLGLGSEGKEAWVYWGQWMIDTRNAIKEIAPNALVSFSYGCWEAWGDPSRSGALTKALQEMDFVSFQSMWPILNQEEWIKDPAAADAAQKARYSGTFGKKPHVWDYHVDEILLLAEKLQKYNKHLYIPHYMLNSHIWGYPNAYNNFTLDQCSVDDTKNLFNDEVMSKLFRLGLFGLTIMQVEDWNEYGGLDKYPFDQWKVWGGDPWHNCGGALFLAGPAGSRAKKPGYQLWVDGINRYSAVRNWADLQPGAATARGTGNEHLWLHVSGRSIKTSPAAAQPDADFIPIGAMYAPGPGGLQPYDEYPQFLTWMKAQGCNTVRLVIWTMTSDGHVPYSSDAEFLKKLNTYWDPIIQYAKSVNLYIVIDAHEFPTKPPASPAPGTLAWTPEAFSVWQKRWGMIAKKYADEPMVLAYELANEPHDIDAEVLQNAMVGAIKEVRAHDKRHIVIISNAAWSHSRALEPTWGDYLQTKGNPDPERNAVFTFHEYPRDQDAPVVEPLLRAFMDKHEVPVLCTEFGTSYENGRNLPLEENKRFQRDLVAMCSRLKVGWMIWDSGASRWPHPDWPYQDIWVPSAKRDASPIPAPKTVSGLHDVGHTKEPVQARMADEAANAVGINTHLSFLDTYGPVWKTIIRPRLLESGIRHIRDGVTTFPEVNDQFRDLAAQGVTGLLVNSDNAQATRNIVKSLNAAHPKFVDAVEPPNEQDLSGADWVARARDAQIGLWNGYKADAALSDIWVLGPSFANGRDSPKMFHAGAPKAGCFMDHGNLHDYTGGRCPEGPLGGTWGESMDKTSARYRRICGDAPLIAGETGFHNAIDAPRDVQPGVTERAAAKLMPRLVLEKLKRGYVRVYFYEFFDQGTDPKQFEHHFGLVRHDGEPKQQFGSLTSFVALLSDKGAAFKPGSLAYTLAGDMTDVQTMLFQKRDGRFYLVLWLGVEAFDVAAKRDIEPAPRSLTLTFDQPVNSVKTYLPSFQGTAVQSSYANPRSIALAVPDHILVVEITAN